MERLAILYHPQLREYDFGPGHPFRGDRQTFPQFLAEKLPEDNYRILEAETATDADLHLICQPDYIAFTRGYFGAASAGLSYAGPFFRYHSADNQPIGRPGKVEEAARLIIGQAKMACRLVQGGEFAKVVSLGGGMHHAHPDYGEGFCLYNDVAFCGLFLLQEYKLERILILDTDAHAGNGTAEYFYGEPRVLFIDLHQDPRTLYPGSGFAHQIGIGKGQGFTINIPMPVDAGDDAYQLAFDAVVAPVAQEFKPQIIIRNGGSDPHFADMLTNLGLSVKGLRMLGEKVKEMAQVCDGKVIDLIGSGYNIKVLPYGWLALITGLGGIALSLDEPEPVPSRFHPDPTLAETERVITEVRGHLKDYWRCLR